MAKQKKPKPNRNLDLTPDLIYKKRSVRFAILVWILVVLVLFGATIAVIEAGPFGLELDTSLGADRAPEHILEVSYAILGGFGLLWMVLAIGPAVFYYRYVVSRRLPSLKTAPPVMATAAAK